MFKARFAIAIFVLCAVAIPGIAETTNCTGITDETARLACRTEARRSYRTGLERALLATGVSAKLFVAETGDPGSGGYPKLIIWTALDKATVYKVISQSKVLDGARGAGFRMVQFTDKGDDGHWFFDLTKPGIAPINVKVATSAVPTSNRPQLHGPE